MGALQSAGKKALDLMVTTLAEITHGNISGRKVHSHSPTDRLPHHLIAAFRQAEYAVYSYGTPIGWVVANVWFVPEVKYSVTTTNHQSALRMAIHYAGGMACAPTGVDPRPLPTA